MQLKNKKIVIIGGTSGIGLSAAFAFIKQGAKVVCVGLNNENIKIAAEQLGDYACILPLDATAEETATTAIDTCLRQFGDFNGLYHVAGGSGRRFGDGPLHELTVEAWEQTLHLNLTSLMLSNRAAVKKFLETGKGGSILNMGSVLSMHPSPKYFATHAYAAAKSAIIGFSKSIAAYYAEKNIRVNVIAPALTATPMSQRAMNDEAILSYVKHKQPLDGGRPGRPQDLDSLAVYFMSDGSAFTTGQVVKVDGGWSVL